MNKDTIALVNTTLERLDNIIYALRPRFVENSLPPSDAPSFGNGHLTFDLLWYEHNGYADGSPSWQGARQVGDDWLFAQIVPGGSGIIYAIEGDADLLWYDHLGHVLGTFRWAGPRAIGTGWPIPTTNPSPRDLLGVFCDTQNGRIPLSGGTVLYAVRADGTLDWFRHDGDGDGAASWANDGQPKTVGSGWVSGLQRVFSGCNGIIYLIEDGGKLRWYKHKGYRDGSFDWEGPNTVGFGWNNFINVFSIGGGIIYAIGQDGTLWWYKHKGYQKGTDDWEDRRNVGSGWNANGFKVVCNSVYLKSTFIN